MNCVFSIWKKAGSTAGVFIKTLAQHWHWTRLVFPAAQQAKTPRGRGLWQEQGLFTRQPRQDRRREEWRTNLNFTLCLLPFKCLQAAVIGLKASEQVTDLDTEGHFCLIYLWKHTENRFNICITRGNVLFQKSTTVFLAREIDNVPVNHI